MRKVLILLTVILFVGCSSDTKETQPITVTTGEVVQQVVGDTCNTTDEVYYTREKDNVTYYNDTKGMTNYWDNRYGDITVNGCDVTLAADEYSPSVSFGGPQATLIYKLTDVYPWSSGDNLMMQLNLSEPIEEEEVHGGIYFNFFMINKHTKERLNYVITIQSFGSAWSKEQSEVLYDPSTDTRFISTTISKSSKHSTISPMSAETNSIGTNFYRVNIPRDVLPIANPSDWFIPFIGVQYELEESLSRGSISAEFSDFSVYITKGIM